MKGLYGLKAFYSRLLSPLSKLAVRAKLSPDLFTWLGVVGGVLGGYGLTIGSSLLVLLGVLVRLAGANLDGVVARARGLESRRGFWVNELGDRLGDWALFAGLAWLGLDPLATFALMLAVALPTAASLWGVVRFEHPRINGGPFGKTERSFSLVILAFTLPALAAPNSFATPADFLTAWAWVVVGGSLITAGMRALRIRSMNRGSRA
jgi:CDP-diacylglycerol--glycerol-3-phosphate 3-phosphatidyltransferase